MKSIFSKKMRQKEIERKSLADAVSNKRLSVEQQLERSIFYGVKLQEFRNEDGSFDLF